jgi:hypothetical protein
MGFPWIRSVALLTCAMPGICAAQTPVPPASQQQTPVASGDPKSDSQLTPDEKRQREIEKYNPRSPRNPAQSALPGDRSPAPPNTDSQSQQPADTQQAAPLPGSIADSNRPAPGARRVDGPEVVSANDAAGADLATSNGPAVLSRSYTISRPLESREVKWTWSVGSTESWQNGLLTGGSGDGSSFGTATNFKFGGRHLWKNDQVGIDYSASYTRYTSAAGYDGANQTLSLDYEHYFSRHLSFNLVENGSIFSQNYSLENPLTTPGLSVANVDLAASPASQALDLRTRQFFTQAGLTWQLSSRLSFNMASGFFAVDRTGPQLTGLTGYQSQADVNYRFSKRMTVGAYYSFADYLYTQHESLSNSHTIGLIYSYAFNRSTQLRLRGGVSRVESLSYTEVPIDPVFAALVGSSFGIVDAYHRMYTSDISAQFIKDLGRKRTANVSFARGLAPGNGLILTAIQETLSASFSMTMFRTYLVSFTGGKSTLSSQTQNTGNYSYDYAGVSVSHALPRGPAANFSVNYRTFNITNMPGLQRQFSVATGVSWSPGPGRLW